MVLLILACSVGCLPDPAYPLEPTLTFQSLATQEDGTATLTLAFTDGDGNVGLTQADTLPPFCQTCEHHYNLVGEYEEWVDNAWRSPPFSFPTLTGFQLQSPRVRVLPSMGQLTLNSPRGT